MSEKTKELVVQEINEELYMDTSEVTIKNLIYVIRGQQVMLDSDVANLYHYETKRINETVRRNKERFPEKFCFQLNEDELAEQVKKYQREDGQYVYDGTFLPQEEIAPLVEAKYCVLTVIMKHQVDSSEETVFELNPYSAGKKDKE